MDDRRRGDTYKSVKNPLLTMAGGGFSLEDIAGGALLVPVSENSSSVLSSDVVAPASEVPPLFPAGPPPAAAASPYASPASHPSAPPSSTPFETPSSQGFSSFGFLGPPAAEPFPFQPVSLEPATGPTPTFYNPESVSQNVTSSFGALRLNEFDDPPVPAVVQGDPQQGLHQGPHQGPARPQQLPVQPVYPLGLSGRPPTAAPSSSGFSTGGTNSYRLASSRKPMYAPVPGLGVDNKMPAPMPAPLKTAPFMESDQAKPLDSPSPSLVPSPEYSSPLTHTPADAVPPQSVMYRPVYHHWFYKQEIENKIIWQPFSMSDSLKLDSQFLSADLATETEVPTDGGRYDVNLLRRQRTAVYWEESPTEVRRCSWFCKGSADSRYVPYDENVCTRLEEEYKQCFLRQAWQHRIEFPNGETVVFHSPNVMVHYLPNSSPDAWGNTTVSPTTYGDGTQHRPKVVKRGVDEFEIDEGEPDSIDHLLFLVHGVGSACDLKFRSLVEVVDDCRRMSQQLIESHFSSSVEKGAANRIEVLPVSWHARLHSDEIQRQLRSITLPSIPKMRHLTNDALIDILFYTSPIYCQTIIQTVAKELNRLYDVFLKRNPSFKGGVSVGGHSLGSLIVFDLLGHQKPQSSPSTPACTPIKEDNSNEDEDSEDEPAPPVPPLKRRLSHKISYVTMGPAGTGQPFITYPQLSFHPENFFALGSPIGLFVTVRGIDRLAEDYALPTCPSFFNIFHPYDLVAYRIESLINPEMEKIPPVLIPHHKGRKRMHLELKETVARMGADFKQKILDSVKSTWNTVYQIAMFHRSDEAFTEEINQVLEEEIRQQAENETIQTDDEGNLNISVGKLNGGRRIDYVLQEAPIESVSEYIFAIGSHVCYWKSEDTMLLMLKEMYQSAGVTVDSQIPQQQVNPSLRMSLAAPVSYSQSSYTEPALLEPSPLFPDSSNANAEVPLGMDPTAPPSDSRTIGPPPMSGFCRK